MIKFFIALYRHYCLSSAKVDKIILTVILIVEYLSMHNRVLFFGPRIIQFSKPNNGLVIWISWSPAETILFILEHCSTKSGRFWFLKIFSWNEKICWSVKNLNVIVANNNSFNTFTLFHNTVICTNYCRLNSEEFQNFHF